ncbi:tRNA pseudouridine(13) synthase TruD [Alteromonas sp. KUL49]|uniref:tRNA pseudouridine(13) synthase TruD n=1 Tax=Alteromonas sp. KUL49 TaxID=2480798 RepID=UPI00102EF126|nr:tRNA pseudouridine(13) synthase TruD [Alteromonas sp. KUL49]TAP39028.1 tRNA pseudouridine(13) synthase TruD [Alteromonas sp. KUL49]GEA12481.1 tRNA pseudouridine synthase D [Alteromonas sp. KUL49]
MNQLDTQHWPFYYGKPSASGVFKTYPDDFQVIEDLGYEPSGEGEHQFIWVEKTNNNTAYVAEQIARFVKLPLRQITYAGRKDKYAKTQQWFGIHAPGKPDFDFSNFDLEGVKVLAQYRHHKKLRTGQLKGNRFIITLRDVVAIDEVTSRLSHIGQRGVPNYYGEQRFGVMRINDQGEVQRGGNLLMAERMVNGETIRHRNKRSMALSALRSWLFNEVVAARINQGHFDSVLDGDALSLTGSNSFYIQTPEASDSQARFDAQDISPTAPLWGKGALPSQGDAQGFETKITEQHAEVTEFLAKSGFEQERRAIKIWPQQLEWTSDGDTLTISFSLPSGCFATSVLRECIETLSPTTHTE